MRIPNEIKIGAHKFQVIYRNRDKDDGIGNFGTSNWQSMKIWIEKDTTETQKEAILLHEILHCINYFGHLELSEEKIQVLEHILYQVLKDNKLSFH